MARWFLPPPPPPPGRKQANGWQEVVHNAIFYSSPSSSYALCALTLSFFPLFYIRKIYLDIQQYKQRHLVCCRLLFNAFLLLTSNNKTVTTQRRRRRRRSHEIIHSICFSLKWLYGRPFRRHFFFLLLLPFKYSKEGKEKKRLSNVFFFYFPPPFSCFYLWFKTLGRVGCNSMCILYGLIRGVLAGFNSVCTT